MAEKSRTLKKKDISGGYSAFLIKYWTNNQKKTISPETQKGWNPEFDGTYELRIGLQKQGDERDQKWYAFDNTNPKISWYLGKDSFKKLFDKIESPEDFYIINKHLGDCLLPNMNYKDISDKVEDLLSRL